MTRHEMRECIFCLLFQKDFYSSDEQEEQMEIFLENFHFPKDRDASDEEKAEIRHKLESIEGYVPQIDDMISSHTKGWKIDRIGKAELAILRLAVYEALYDESVPVGVAVNEAVELAKAYGEDQAPAFVNGILGKIVNE